MRALLLGVALLVITAAIPTEASLKSLFGFGKRNKLCGNGVIDPGEHCDFALSGLPQTDTNPVSKSCCSSSCRFRYFEKFAPWQRACKDKVHTMRDAGFRNMDGEYVWLQGRQFAKCTTANCLTDDKKHSTMLPGYPRDIAGAFQKLPSAFFSDIDAVCAHPDGQTFWFKEKSYVVMEFGEGVSKTGFIADLFGSDVTMPKNFRVTSSFYLEAEHGVLEYCMLLSKDTIYRYNIISEKMETPQPITQYFAGATKFQAMIMDPLKADKSLTVVAGPMGETTYEFSDTFIPDDLGPKATYKTPEMKPFAHPACHVANCQACAAGRVDSCMVCDEGYKPWRGTSACVEASTLVNVDFEDEVQWQNNAAIDTKTRFPTKAANKITFDSGSVNRAAVFNPSLNFALAPVDTSVDSFDLRLVIKMSSAPKERAQLFYCKPKNSLSDGFVSLSLVTVLPGQENAGDVFVEFVLSRRTLRSKDVSVVGKDKKRSFAKIEVGKWHHVRAKYSPKEGMTLWVDDHDINVTPEEEVARGSGRRSLLQAHATQAAPKNEVFDVSEKSDGTLLVNGNPITDYYVLRGHTYTFSVKNRLSGNTFMISAKDDMQTPYNSATFKLGTFKLTIDDKTPDVLYMGFDRSTSAARLLVTDPAPPGSNNPHTGEGYQHLHFFDWGLGNGNGAQGFSGLVDSFEFMSDDLMLDSTVRANAYPGYSRNGFAYQREVEYDLSNALSVTYNGVTDTKAAIEETADAPSPTFACQKLCREMDGNRCEGWTYTGKDGFCYLLHTLTGRKAVTTSVSGTRYAQPMTMQTSSLVDRLKRIFKFRTSRLESTWKAVTSYVDTDFNSGDLDDKYYAHEDGSYVSLDTCVQACLARDECVGYSYGLEGKYNGECWFKGRASPKRRPVKIIHAKGIISGYVRYRTSLKRLLDKSAYIDFGVDDEQGFALLNLRAYTGTPSQSFQYPPNPEAASARACMHACDLAGDECLVFSFHKDPDPVDDDDTSETKRTCNLFKTEAGLEAKERTVSGWKYKSDKDAIWQMFVDVAFNDGDLRGEPLSVLGPNDCRAKCVSEAECVGFTYFRSGRFEGECWLKGLATATRPPAFYQKNVNAVSGLKTSVDLHDLQNGQAYKGHMLEGVQDLPGSIVVELGVLYATDSTFKTFNNKDAAECTVQCSEEQKCQAFTVQLVDNGEWVCSLLLEAKREFTAGKFDGLASNAISGWKYVDAETWLIKPGTRLDDGNLLMEPERMKSGAMPTVAECKQRCEEHPHCVAFSFSRGGDFLGDCWLKGMATPTRAAAKALEDADWVSGFVNSVADDVLDNTAFVNGPFHGISLGFAESLIIDGRVIYGGDHNIGEFLVKSADQCANNCNLRDDCVAFTVSEGSCLLKDKLETRNRDASATSGFKRSQMSDFELYPSTIFTHGGLSEFPAVDKDGNALTPWGCADRCRTTSGCAGFSYARAEAFNGECFLKGLGTGSRRAVVSATNDAFFSGVLKTIGLEKLEDNKWYFNSGAIGAPDGMRDDAQTMIIVGALFRDGSAVTAENGLKCEKAAQASKNTKKAFSWDETKKSCTVVDELMNFSQKAGVTSGWLFKNEANARNFNALSSTQFSGADLNTPEVMSPAECLIACSTSSVCKAFTYFRAGPQVGRCELKGAADASVNRPAPELVAAPFAFSFIRNSITVRQLTGGHEGEPDDGNQINYADTDTMAYEESISYDVSASSSVANSPVTANQLSECMDKCSGIEQCEGVTFIKAKKQCNLLAQMINREVNKLAASAWKFNAISKAFTINRSAYLGPALNGNFVVNSKGDTPSPPECELMCGVNQQCAAFTYYRTQSTSKTGPCWHFGLATETREAVHVSPDGGAVSGVKTEIGQSKLLDNSAFHGSSSSPGAGDDSGFATEYQVTYSSSMGVTTSATTMDLCKARCVKAPDCVGVSFQFEMCTILKKDEMVGGHREENEHATSAWRTTLDSSAPFAWKLNIDYQNGDLEAAPRTNVSPFECLDACKANSKCVGITFYRKGNFLDECWLKGMPADLSADVSRAASKLTNPDAVSALRGDVKEASFAQKPGTAISNVKDSDTYAIEFRRAYSSAAASVSADSVDACEDMCSKTNGCVGVSFSDKMCSKLTMDDMKSANRVKDSTAVSAWSLDAKTASGFNWKVNIEYQNGDLETAPRTNVSPFECLDACKANSKCVGITFYRKGTFLEECWLKGMAADSQAGVALKKTNSVAVSALKADVDEGAFTTPAPSNPGTTPTGGDTTEYALERRRAYTASNTQAFPGSMEECQAHCSSDKNCVGVTVVSNMCHVLLMSEMIGENRVKDENAVSAWKLDISFPFVWKVNTEYQNGDLESAPHTNLSPLECLEECSHNVDCVAISFYRGKPSGESANDFNNECWLKGMPAKIDRNISVPATKNANDGVVSALRNTIHEDAFTDQSGKPGDNNNNNPDDHSSAVDTANFAIEYGRTYEAPGALATTVDSLAKCEDNCKDDPDCVGITYSQRTCWMLANNQMAGKIRKTDRFAVSAWKLDASLVQPFVWKPDVDYQGGNLELMPIELVSPFECIDACKKKDKCVAITFYRGNNFNNECWLKGMPQDLDASVSSSAHVRVNKDAYSAIKNDVDEKSFTAGSPANPPASIPDAKGIAIVPGRKFQIPPGSTIKTAATVSDCLDLCAADDACHQFNYDQGTQQCSLEVEFTGPSTVDPSSSFGYKYNDVDKSLYHVSVGVNYDGGNLASGDIANFNNPYMVRDGKVSVRIPSPDECEDECDKLPDCVAWSYFRAGGFQGQCWLKGFATKSRKAAKRFTDARVISGVLRSATEEKFLSEYDPNGDDNNTGNTGDNTKLQDGEGIAIEKKLAYKSDESTVLQSESSVSASECMRMCVDMKECVGFTYSHADKKCDAFKVLTRAKINNGATSGYKYDRYDSEFRVTLNLDYNGGDIAINGVVSSYMIDGHLPSPIECERGCGDNPACDAFSYARSGRFEGECWFKARATKIRAAPIRIENPNMIVGVKRAVGESALLDDSAFENGSNTNTAPTDTLTTAVLPHVKYSRTGLWKSVSTDSYTACAQKCEDAGVSQCVAFTHTKPTKCRMYTNLSGPTADENSNTGIVLTFDAPHWTVRSSFAFVSSDVLKKYSVNGNFASPIECSRGCSNTSDCVAFTFYRSGPNAGQCYLYGKGTTDRLAPRNIADKMAISGYQAGMTLDDVTNNDLYKGGDFNGMTDKSGILLEKDVTYEAHDDDETVDVQVPEHCLDKCAQQENCIGFTVSGTTCVIKTQLSGRKKKVGAVSGWKYADPDGMFTMELDIDFQDGNIADFYTVDGFPPSPLECMEACKRLPECAAFSFYRAPPFEGQCWFKGVATAEREAPLMVVSQNAISGRRIPEAELLDNSAFENNGHSFGSNDDENGFAMQQNVVYGSGFDIETDHGTPRECFDECSDREACVGFSVDADGLCHLMSKLVGATRVHGALSGWRYRAIDQGKFAIKLNVDYNGSDLYTRPLRLPDGGTPSPQDCELGCDADPKCVAFTYNRGDPSSDRFDTECWLKKMPSSAADAATLMVRKSLIFGIRQGVNPECLLKPSMAGCSAGSETGSDSANGSNGLFSSKFVIAILIVLVAAAVVGLYCLCCRTENVFKGRSRTASDIAFTGGGGRMDDYQLMAMAKGHEQEAHSSKSKRKK